MSSIVDAVGLPNLERNDSHSRSTVAERLLHDALEHPVDYFLSRPGKGIRAQLIEIAYQAAGGVDDLPIKLIDFVELLHAGSLIIDDIQDNSRNRRDQETLHLKFGVSVGINTGNWLYFSALESLAQVGTSPVQTMNIMKRSLSIIKRCHEGQALDLTATFDGLTPKSIPSTVRRISELKTGALTGLAAWLGGAVATEDPQTLNTLSRFGKNLGIGLQMQNDFVELHKVANSQCSSDDLKNRRCTWPWAWLAEAYPAAEVQRLAKLAVRQLPEPQEFAQQLLERIEIVAVNEINGQLEEAIQQLHSLDIDPTIAQRMNQIVATLELQNV